MTRRKDRPTTNADFAPIVAQGQRVLGLDYGSKRVGVAVSDSLLLLAHGRETVHYRHRRELWEGLAALIQAEAVGLIVVGLPRRLSGEEGDMTARVRDFVTELQARNNLPVITWDERLTSRQAERMLHTPEQGRRRGKGEIDRAAAILILQSYLDSLPGHKASA